ncbi:MAG: DUF3368 domain-containing protein [Planctomycetota bacterium]
MAEPPVVNASPLILLAKAGLMEFLRLAGEPVLVPDDVAREVRAYNRGKSGHVLKDFAWLKIVPVIPVPSQIQAWDLGDGESSVLAWAAAHPGTIAILDDLAARRCAAALGIPVRGCLGLVLRAKQRGVIPAARPAAERLRATGLYLSDRVLNEALALVGE